ncbi:MAG: hypothetical protein KBD36_05980 [Alphaproteobacteria bacterium]|nr:hypothetical protein [Alphaproteobacteria bacterium]MBP9777370.1 hypothetical protein [Alphaproteobacteria bacterium]
MIKFMKCAVSTVAIFFFFTVESSAKENNDNPPVRISAIFKGWSNNFDENVTFMLPGGESIKIEVIEGKRLSIDEEYTGLIEGGKISYKIISEYGGSTQEDSCEGHISLRKGDLALDGIQLQFTPIVGANPKEDGPWFACVIGKKYK